MSGYMDEQYAAQEEFYRLQDAFIRQLLVNGISIYYPDRIEREKEKVRHRREYIAKALRWPEMPFLVWINLNHYLWLTGKAFSYDCRNEILW